jgi:hypothetical protein
MIIRNALLGLLVVAAPIWASAESPRVRLLQPAQESSLTGGTTALLRWSADDVAQRPGVEEWEAFLSLDGGRYYGARITPHLDISIREFRWVVPNVESADARILIRFGNEREEIAVEFPGSLRITPSVPSAIASASVRATTPGERARPGDPGVAVWVEGDRSGGRLMDVATSIPSIDRHATLRINLTHSGALPRAPCAMHPVPLGEEISECRFTAHRGVTPPPPDVLLKSRRLNI